MCNAVQNDQQRQLPQFIEDLEWDSAPNIGDMPDGDLPQWDCHRTRMAYLHPLYGLGSHECPGYVATRHELLGVAIYWLTAYLNIQTRWFCYGEPVDDDDQEVQYLALDRLDRLAEVLDREDRRWVESEVEKDFQERLGDEYWRAYKAHNIALARLQEESERASEQQGEGVTEPASPTTEEPPKPVETDFLSDLRKTLKSRKEKE